MWYINLLLTLTLTLHQQNRSVLNWWCWLKFYCPHALADGNQHIQIREKTLEFTSSVLSTHFPYTVSCLCLHKMLEKPCFKKLQLYCDIHLRVQSEKMLQIGQLQSRMQWHCSD